MNDPYKSFIRGEMQASPFRSPPVLTRLLFTDT